MHDDKGKSKRSCWIGRSSCPAIGNSFRKLNPRQQWKNPVMFVVLVGARADERPVRPGAAWATARPARGSSWACRCGCGSRCCSPTSPRRWPRGAARPRPTAFARPGRTCIRQAAAREPRRWSAVRGAAGARRRCCVKGDVVFVEAGEFIPPTARSSRAPPAWTRAPSPARSPRSSARAAATASAVTGGTRVLSDWLVVRVTRRARRDLPRPHDRDGRGGQAAEDPQRDRPEHPAGGADDHLPGGLRDAAAVFALQRAAGRAGQRR